MKTVAAADDAVAGALGGGGALERGEERERHADGASISELDHEPYPSCGADERYPFADDGFGHIKGYDIHKHEFVY